MPCGAPRERDGKPCKAHRLYDGDRPLDACERHTQMVRRDRGEKHGVRSAAATQARRGAIQLEPFDDEDLATYEGIHAFTRAEASERERLLNALDATRTHRRRLDRRFIGGHLDNEVAYHGLAGRLAGEETRIIAQLVALEASAREATGPAKIELSFRLDDDTDDPAGAENE